jgi:lactate dehydrogenase-like 2-hydroxyacid dehydrogenase
MHLSSETAPLTKGFDSVCIFPNDTVNKEVIEILVRNNIRLVALRCAGYNNVDLKTIYGKIHVVRVPAYSPYAIAEHAVALMLALNRKIPKAYNRTRDYNFALEGLLGFDMADKYLSSDKQEELIREFDRMEQEKIGEGKHEELHGIMKELKKIYLEEEL